MQLVCAAHTKRSVSHTATKKTERLQWWWRWWQSGSPAVAPILKKKKKSRQGASAGGEEERSQSGVAERAERELSKPQAGATDRLRPI